MERLFESARQVEPVTPETLARIERREPPEPRGAQRRWVLVVAMVVAGVVVFVQSRTSVRAPKPVAVRTVPAVSPNLGPAVDGVVETARADASEASSRGAEIEAAILSGSALEAVSPRATGSRRGAESARPDRVLEASAASPSEGAASGAGEDEGSGSASGAVASAGSESASGAVASGGSESASGAVASCGSESASGAVASGGSESASGAIAPGGSESASGAGVSGGSESASEGVASGGSAVASGAVASGGSESASGAFASAVGGARGAGAPGAFASTASPPAAVAPSFRNARRSRPKGLRRTLPAYQPRAVRELVELGTQRLADRELTAEVRRILALTDRRSMLAQLDRIAIDDPDVIALRGALRVEAQRCPDALADLSRVERLAPRSPAASYASRVRRWCVAAR
ncbi:MAG: hypothetical protein RIT81_27745 [Deltaproteobacteria bacterium]